MKRLAGWSALMVAMAAASARAETVRVPVSRDTWVSAVGSEAEANLGGSPRMKLKSIQEMSLVDLDPKPLKGRVVRSARLHVKLADKPRLWRVTVSSVSSDWVEGTAPSYQPQKGSSSFNHQRNPDVPWAYPGSDLTSVVLGLGGSVWGTADASEPDAERWQTVAVAPKVVAARVAGTNSGFLVFDDTGSEWTRNGDEFHLRLFPNRYIFSKDQNRASAPYFTIELGPEDHQPPDRVGEISVRPLEDLPAGEAVLTWETPADRGEAGVVGFFVEVDGKPVRRDLIPAASEAGKAVSMHLRDLDVKPGAEVRVSVRGVDGAGNVGAERSKRVTLSSLVPKPLPEAVQRPRPDPKTPLPKLSGAEVAVVDELDKVHPVSGEMIPPQPRGYLASNHLWRASDRTVRLQAAKGEFVAFQVVIRGSAGEKWPEARLETPDGQDWGVEIGRYQTVPTKKGPLPDPIVPMDFPGETPENATSRSLHVEIYVPKDAKAGEHSATLSLQSQGETLSLPVKLQVWNFTLPDHLSFLPEMNCYGLPKNERDYYRLAHKHRTVLNRLGYHHSGDVAEGCAPEWNGRTFDWTAWDERFGPLLDGSAFADLPRSGVPIEAFYLPLFENWPTPMEGNYNGDYWADRAFPESYRDTFVEASRQFAQHMNEKGYHDTLLEFYLNGKNNFKQNGWSRGTCPWLLDEPANFQDYWALHYFGSAFHRGINQAQGPAKLVFRCDISRPQWQRDVLDDVLDVNVVGSAFRKYRRMVLDRKRGAGQVVIEYGGSNPLEESNVQPLAWAVDSWSLGSDGVLPWQTVGKAESWTRGDELSLFYPTYKGHPGPIPSVRLKAYRRGQQDVEYLTLLTKAQDQPRWAVGAKVREALRSEGRSTGSGFAGGEDAGIVRYGRLTPQDFWALRTRVARVLSEKAPEPKDRLVEFRTPKRIPRSLQPRIVRGALPARD
jgi:hypothetical protein